MLMREKKTVPFTPLRDNFRFLKVKRLFQTIQQIAPFTFQRSSAKREQNYILLEQEILQSK